MLKKLGKRGQLSVFVIVAIVLVLGVVVYFMVRGSMGGDNIPKELSPVYNSYSSCIEEKAKTALEIAGNQGGRIYLDDYEPGSAYAPFANQLNFLGIGVPYWYYISANGFVKESVPTINEIQRDVSSYVASSISECDFSQYYSQGFEINFGNSVVNTSIADNKVVVDVESRVSVKDENTSAVKSSHRVTITSKFGKFYNIAREIYDKEKNEAFLENYTLDTLYANSPVDGVEISCAPKVWKSREVDESLRTALENTISTLKFSGNQFDLKNKEREYFVIDQNIDENVNLIYSKSWPTKLEINGDGVDSELMIAKPVGNQPGLGVMGFCYSPYHFVYDLSYPVMIQVYDDQEIFQFPVAVVIDKNKPRVADASEIDDSSSFDLCQYKTQDVQVNLYNTNLESVNANLSFQCFDQQCSMGESKNGQFSGKIPACVNGYIIADSDGYAQKKELFSSNEQSNVELILDKSYPVTIDLKVDGKSFSNGNAIVIFNGADSVSASIPDNKDIKLKEGLYNVTVYVYGNSSLSIPASSKQQCTEVSQTGILGLFGGTKEQCYDINIPETKLEYALIGGGNSEVYLLPSDLENNKMSINVESLPNPGSIEELSVNFESFSSKSVEVSFG